MEHNQTGDVVVLHKLRHVPECACGIVLQREFVAGSRQRHCCRAMVDDVTAVQFGDIAETDDLLLSGPERRVPVWGHHHWRLRATWCMHGKPEGHHTRRSADSHSSIERTLTTHSVFLQLWLLEARDSSAPFIHSIRSAEDGTRLVPMMDSPA